MSRLSLLILVLLFTASPLGADERNPIDFDSEIIPILTKAGCNSGACHGAAAGRGEFHLSLFGSNPGFDYDSIVQEFEGRRLNRARPEQSLLLLKATETIPHGGGTRINLESLEQEHLQTWIAQGAQRLLLRKLKVFEVTPAEQVLDAANPNVRWTAAALLHDGSTKTVTQGTVFTAEDDSAVLVDAATGQATVRRPGRHVVIARYLNWVVPLVVILPYGSVPVDLSSMPEGNIVDHEVYKLLEILRIPAALPAGDATFLRRLSLDLTGQLPQPSQVRHFLKDERPNKRQLLIESLLNTSEFTDYWTYEFAKLLRIRSQPQDRIGAQAYTSWLRQQIANSTPYNQIAYSLLTAQGDSHLIGPANFYRTTSGPRAQAEFVSELFLGSRLRCANCHDHPLDHWTQDDYHGLAAIFAGVKMGRNVLFSTGEVIHPRTSEPAMPRIPGEEDLKNQQQLPVALADWITSDQNPYFAKAIVNRLWKRLMGRGLIEPTDDLRATNPATHPELLNALTIDFIEHGYDLQHTIQLIVNSAAYARGEQSTPENFSDDRFYSHALVRPLEPEVLADAIADVTGVPLELEIENAGVRAIQLYDFNTSSPELATLGRCSGIETCEDSPANAGGLSLMLHLLNGELLNSRIQSPTGRLFQLIETQGENHKIIEEIYLSALSRFPDEQESWYWSNELQQVQTKSARTEILQDMFWAILSSTEFTTNH